MALIPFIAYAQIYALSPVGHVGELRPETEASGSVAVSQSSVALNSFIQLQMGQNYQFLVSSTSSYGVGGSWSADYGTITPAGLYTPSTYLTDAGIDIVTYSGPAGISARFAIKLTVPNGYTPSTPIVVPPNFFDLANLLDKSPTPWSANPKFELSEIDAPQGFGVLTESEIDELAPGWLQNDDTVALFPADNKSHVMVVGGTPLGPIQSTNLINCRTVPQEAVEGQIGFPVPTEDTLESGIFISASAMTNPLVICEMAQVYPDSAPTGPCLIEGEQRRVAGQKKRWTKRLPFVNLGSIRITADLQAKILKWVPGAAVNIGADVTISGQNIDYTENYTYDEYECRNGVWKYKGPGQCVRSAWGLKTNPKWAAPILGYAMDGGPSGWTPWSCARIGK